MASYWWQCDTCQVETPFNDVSPSTGIVSFIRRVLLPSNWDQSKLVLPCPKCGKPELRITYDFPRGDGPVRLSIVHVVGLIHGDDAYYLPMMWETQPSSDEGTWFDFKYINGNSIYGLNRPAVFSRDELRTLFKEYERYCGGGSFP
ncbi:MAG: hypothetical protein JO038_09120 [Alphaproteobacteria bacterium]|nr:hypothetical protein [Alphaproteobacteria bacterium]